MQNNFDNILQEHEHSSVCTYFNKNCFGIWLLKNRIQYNAMLCLSDHQTMAFKDQSKIPKATFIEIGEYALLTKREAKMTRYWPSSFLRFY